nr:L polymerase [unidentified Reptarenavirus]
MGSLGPEDVELNRLKDLTLKVLSFERDLYRPTWISDTAGEMAVSAIKLRSTIHELNCCRDTGLKFNNEQKELNDILDEVFEEHETVKTIVPDGYLIDFNNCIVSVLEASTRSEASDQCTKATLDRMKYDGIEIMLRPLGWTLNVIVISEKKPRIGSIPESLMFKLLTTSISVLSYTTSVSDWISEEDYLEIKRSMTTYDFRSLTEEFEGQGLIFDIQSEEDPYSTLLRWLETKTPPFSLEWEGQQITEALLDFKERKKKLRLLEIMRASACGLSLSSEHLSILNKLKSLNLLNTRRQQNKVYDYLALVLFVKAGKSTDFPSGWIPSVNDRLIRIDSIDLEESNCKRLITKMIISLRAIAKESGSKTKAQDFEHLIRFLEDMTEEFKDLNELTKAALGLNPTPLVGRPHIELKITNDFPKTRGEVKGVQPLTDNECSNIEKVALNLVLSQKTRSTPKASDLEEFFFQSFGGCMLLYRCTGEGQKAFSLLCNTKGVREFFSFNINPSRLFPLIFSKSPINELINQMMLLVNPIDGELEKLEETINKQRSINVFLVENKFNSSEIDDLRGELKYLVYGILTTPTKRLQVELQSQRYYVMDAMSMVHHRDLKEKIVGHCITHDEYYLRALAHRLINKILSCFNIGLFLKVTWSLNISYLCHLITKETPDRLSDLRDCYEKFFKPKFQFMSNLIYNCKTVDELVERMEAEVNDFIRCDEPSLEMKPFLYEPILADFLSWVSNEKFNGLDGEQLLNPKDYLTSSVDVLDLTSNKSTFKRSRGCGNVLDPAYDTGKLLKRVICERLHKRVTKKKKDGKEMGINNSEDNKNGSIKDWKPGKEKGKKTRIVYEEFSTIIQGLLTEIGSDEGLDDFLLRVNSSLEEIGLELEKIKSGEVEQQGQLSLEMNKYSYVLDKISSILGHEIRDVIKSTCYSTKLSDLPSDILTENGYKTIVESIMEDRPLEFQRGVETVDITNITAGMVVAKFEAGEYFSSFKFLLLWAGFNNFQGTYDHRSGAQSSYLSLSNKYRGESMISTRVTNSEALQERLLAIRYGAPTLRNVLFSTLNLEIGNSEVGPNNKPLQFGLAIKEQVGGPRELYVGDSDTKLITRVLEETSRNIGNKLTNSCLNSERKFSDFMKRIARSFYENEIVLSMDHSKWGPYNSPLQYHLLYEAMESINDVYGKKLNFSFVKTILKWHLFKSVETPQILAEDIVLSALDISVGRRQRQIDKERTYETFMINSLLSKSITPSQIHSWFDMGQGILHYTSDLYGALVSEYITRKVRDLYGIKCSTMNTSDDMVLLIHTKYKPDDLEIHSKLVTVINFIYLVSNCLNKHISPKFCCSPLVGEFKSHFEVEATMVPLFVKFFSASINNFRCKTPMELFNTCDTIVEQGICNGMSLKLGDSLKRRMVDMLGWLGYIGDPLMHPVVSRQQDWLEGCLSYRKLRSVEEWLVKEGITRQNLEVLKAALLSVVRDLREGLIAPSAAYTKMCQICLTTFNSKEVWFPTKHGEFKLVVRSKLNLGTTINETCDNLFVKKLINHYSRYSKQGLGLLIAEGLERSAFQSSVVTGFIGLSISLSGQCVRKGDGTFLTLRESRAVTRPIGEIFSSLIMQSICSVGDWVCGIESVLPKPVNRSIYMRTSLLNVAEFKFGLDELTATVELCMPDLFDKYLKDLVPPEKRLLMKHSWKVRPEMEMLMECANDGLSVFDGRIDRSEEAVVLVDFNDPTRSQRRVIRQEKIGSERTVRNSLQSILNRMILNSILEPRIIDKVLVQDATKITPFTGSVSELKSYKTSGVRRYIQQVILGRDSFYRLNEGSSEYPSDEIVMFREGSEEKPMSDGTWIIGARIGLYNPIKLSCIFNKIGHEQKMRVSMLSYIGRAHLQDFLYLKRFIISDLGFDKPEALDTIDFSEVNLIENPSPNGKPCYLYMGSIVPFDLGQPQDILTPMGTMERDERWRLLRTYFLTRQVGEIELLPLARFTALDHMVTDTFEEMGVEEIVEKNFHVIECFEEFLKRTNRCFCTQGPTIVFHRTRGILVASPNGTMMYRNLRVETLESWLKGELELEVLED